MHATRPDHDHRLDALAPVPWVAVAVLAGLAIAFSTAVGLLPNTLLALLFWLFLA